MNKRLQRVMFATALAAMPFGTVFANEVIATVVDSKGGGRAVSFDMATDGGVAGFSFKMQMPGLMDKGFNLGSCVSQLPAGFDGGCSVVGDTVYVYAVSNRMDLTLPAGVVPIGQISLSIAPGAKSAGEIKISELSVGSASAKELPASARVVADRSDMRLGTSERIK